MERDRVAGKVLRGERDDVDDAVQVLREDGVKSPSLEPNQPYNCALFTCAAAEIRSQGIGGRYFEDCHEAEVGNQLHGIWGVLPHSLNPDDARRLWKVSEEMLAAARVNETGQVTT